MGAGIWDGLKRNWREVLYVAAAIVTLVLGWLELRRRRRARGDEPSEDSEVEESPPSFAGLAARPAVNTRGFRARVAELARLNQLVADGKRVIWVTGPTQAGKTWLVSQWVRDNGDEGVFARFEMERGATVEGLLEGINSFLCRCGEGGFDAACRAPEASIEQRIAALARVLDARRWSLLLDSFETVGEAADFKGFVEKLQSDLRGSVVLVGSRVMPGWGDGGAELPVREIGTGAGYEILAEQDVAEEHRARLYDKVQGLPGALVRIAMLVRNRGPAAVEGELEGTAAEVGAQLLRETYEALSEGGQRLWAGLCLLPAPVTRKTAREVCAREDFAASWDELAQWKLLQMTEGRGELHPLARAVGERRLEGMVQWKRACALRIAKHYAQFAKDKTKDRAALEAELGNVLAAARLAFRYEEWEALWGMGGPLYYPLGYYRRYAARDEVLQLSYQGAGKAHRRDKRALFACHLGSAEQHRGRYSSARALQSEALMIGQEEGNQTIIGHALHGLGWVALQERDYQGAEDLYRKALEAQQAAQDRLGQAHTLHQLGLIARKPDEAKVLYEQSLELKRTVQADPGTGEADAWSQDAWSSQAVTLNCLARLAQEAGDIREAKRLCKESLDIARETGHMRGQARALRLLRELCRAGGNACESEAAEVQQALTEVEHQLGEDDAAFNQGPFDI